MRLNSRFVWFAIFSFERKRPESDPARAKDEHVRSVEGPTGCAETHHHYFTFRISEDETSTVFDSGV